MINSVLINNDKIVLIDLYMIYLALNDSPMNTSFKAKDGIV